jgi:hypothetical protein
MIRYVRFGSGFVVNFGSISGFGFGMLSQGVLDAQLDLYFSKNLYPLQKKRTLLFRTMFEGI